MKRTIRLLALCAAVCGLAGCGTDSLLTSDADDVFTVRSQGNDMLVKVQGNTQSRVMLLFVHGGPGEGSWVFNKFAGPLKEKYGVALWDQANSGSTQGNSSGTLSVARTLEDLDKVVKALQYRYDDGFKFYLIGHSCGGGFCVGYLGEGTHQAQFAGYINIDGAHNLTLVKVYQRTELLKRAGIEISQGRHTGEWKKMQQFCQDHPVINTIEEFTELSLNCGNATALLDSVNTFSLVDGATFFGEYSFFSYLSNWSSLWSQEAYIREIFWQTDFTDRLPAITLPTLVIWGRYDLNLSYDMARNYLDNVGSTDTTVAIMERSGHYPFATETDLTGGAIISFIERTR